MTFPPGPEQSSLSQATRLGKEPYAFLRECAREFGEVFTIRLPGDRIVVCSGTEAIQDILHLRPEQIVSHKTNITINLGDTSLLFLDGEPHRRERKLLVPPLHGDRITVFGELMQELTRTAVQRWRPGDTIDLAPEFEKLALSVITRCIFGVLDERRVAELEARVRDWTAGAMSPPVFMAGLLFEGWRVRGFLERQTLASLRKRSYTRARLLPWHKLADAKARIVELLREEIAALRTSGTHGREDLLALLVDARDEDGESLSEQHIIDELLTMLVGGHDTTANTLGWVILDLVRNREVLDEVHAELDRVFAGGPVDVKRIRECELLSACIDESMRLTPVAPGIPRRLREPATIAGYPLPAETVVWACDYLAHHNPAIWGEDVERFRPARFLAGRRFKANEFFPFGGGNRRCIGAAFASYEMRVVLAQLLSMVSFGPGPGPHSQPTIHGVAVSPSAGVKVTVRARASR
jgi:cytochrome P450